MTEYLKIEDMMYQRDDKEQLLPVDLVLTTLERKKFVDVKDSEGKVISKKVVVTKPAPTIKVFPAPRGKWLSIIKMKPEEQDREILFNHVVEPKIDESAYAAMKPTYVEAVIKSFALLVLDLTPEEIKGKTKEELTEAEEFEIQKNLSGGKDEQLSSSTNLDTPSSPSQNLPIEK